MGQPIISIKSTRLYIDDRLGRPVDSQIGPEVIGARSKAKLPTLPPHTTLPAAHRPPWAHLLAPSQPKVRRAAGCPRSTRHFP